MPHACRQTLGTRQGRPHCEVGVASLTAALRRLAMRALADNSRDIFSNYLSFRLHDSLHCLRL